MYRSYVTFQEPNPAAQGVYLIGFYGLRQDDFARIDDFAQMEDVERYLALLYDRDGVATFGGEARSRSS
jgi:hypothetical protein